MSFLYTLCPSLVNSVIISHQLFNHSSTWNIHLKYLTKVIMTLMLQLIRFLLYLWILLAVMRACDILSQRWIQKFPIAYRVKLQTGLNHRQAQICLTWTLVTQLQSIRSNMATIHLSQSDSTLWESLTA